MTGRAKLEKALLKNPSSRFFILTAAVLGKLRTCKKIFIKETHLTLQPDNTKHKPFQFISLPKFIEGFQP